MSQGKIVQIIGAVVDVEFPRDAIPHVYDALKLVERPDFGSAATSGGRRSPYHCDGKFRRIEARHGGKQHRCADYRARRQGNTRPHYGRAGKPR